MYGNFTDIREYKKALRAKYKDFRKNLSETEKSEKDNAVLRKIISSEAYKRCEMLLTYVSTAIEVDTRGLIATAMKDGKAVIVPKCVDGTREMKFYEIHSLDDLEICAFGVLEPIPDKCREITVFENAVCIVPGLAFDLDGYRLGYGGGYYDRFLSAHRELYNIGICYCGCTVNRLEHGRFDVPVNMLITEKYMRKINKGA